MNEPIAIETVTVRGQQQFDLHNILNPIETEINNDRIISILKNQKYTYYKLMPIGILFPSSVANDTKQILVLNNPKAALINGKIYSILGILNLDKNKQLGIHKGKTFVGKYIIY